MGEGATISSETRTGGEYDERSGFRGKIKEVFGTQDAFADAIGLGRVSVSQRLNNQLEFSQQEMFRSADVLGFSRGEIPEYFFTEKVQKDERTEH